MLKIIIGEDNALVAQQLKGIVENLGYQVLDVQHSVTQILNAIENNKPDLVILDIRMDVSDAGILIARVLNEKEIPFIFISAHGDDKTLHDAALTKPLSFILKPFSEAQIKATLGTLSVSIEKREGVVIKGKLVPLVLGQITYIKIDNVYCEIYMATKHRHLIRIGLKALLQELNYADLKQVHRSYVVNKTYIKRIKRNKILLHNGEEIPYTTSYK
jgi:DNA-binding LytR/AlgR family response regulator